MRRCMCVCMFVYVRICAWVSVIANVDFRVLTELVCGDHQIALNVFDSDSESD